MKTYVLGTRRRGKSRKGPEGPKWLGSEVSRRAFLQGTGTLLAGVTVGNFLFKENRAAAQQFGDPVLVETDPRVSIRYSVCQGCHSRCGIRVRVVDGILQRIDGNPFHPNNRDDHLPFDTDPNAAKAEPAKLCAKGLAGMQSLYDPYRLKEPLKRVGPRGSGKWQTISWEQAFREIGAVLQRYRDFETLIDPNAPELGPIANMVAFSGGRNQQNAFTDLFWKNVYGTINFRHDHTTICEASHHIAHELMTGYGLNRKTSEHTKPDLLNTDFLLVFGADYCQANFPFLPIARKYIEMVERGGKVYVVDPICNVMASKGKWIPIRPGRDAALANAVARVIVDNGWYNTAFLQRPHDGAANPTGELNVTDATLLVRIVDGHPYAFLRADEAGIEGGTNQEFVVWSGGTARKYTDVDVAELMPGELESNGHRFKTAFELYLERVREYTVEEYSEACGVPVETIVQLAQELVAAGRRSAVSMYRGSVQHTNGTYTGRCILALNLLVGNFNWKGGLAFGGGGYRAGGYTGAPYPTPDAVPGGVTPRGIPVTRVKVKYEDSSEFRRNGYPAKRPWFPLALHYNYQEIMPSIEEGYPYPIKALILYWNGLPYSTPAQRAVYERVLRDESKIELIVGIDIAMGEATAWCDYVLPDTTYFERWTVVSLPPTIITKASPVRQPVVGTVDAEGNYTPVLPNTKMLEDILIGLARTMGWPIPFRNAWEYWRQRIENVAKDDANYSVQDILARGGRFEDAVYGYEGDRLKNRYTERLYFFNEYMAKTHDSMTGLYFDGLPKWQPIADVLDRPITLTLPEYPLQLVTYKKGYHTQMHTIRYPWLVAIQPENFVEISAQDAAARDIHTGDFVRLRTPNYPQGVIGLALVTQRLTPGVVAVSHHFGHWEMSSRPHIVDGLQTAFDVTRAAGITVTPMLRTDPYLGNVTLQDKVGGSASFYDTCVEVEKI